MRGKTGQIVRFGLLLAVILYLPLWSGTTGKIAGTIIDQVTGDPLPGANVVVAETGLGAAADMNGRYTILHVPPGMYHVEVSVIGYAKASIRDVRVRIDQTTHVDVGLTMEAVEGETVTIVAERALIKGDVATSVVAVSSQEVEALPVSNVEEVIKLQAGIEDDLKIRGSKNEAALFLLDGVSLRDPRNNEPITKVALSAVKEISVERGGFNAEYGQVQSGIINVVTQEGSKNNYNGSVTAKVAPPAPKYWPGKGIPDIHDPSSYWMRPYLDDAVCWTGTAIGEPYEDLNENGKWDAGEPYEDLNGDNQRSYWDQYMQDQYLDFQGWNVISEQLLMDNNPDNDLTPLGCQRVFMYETRKRQRNELADYDIDAGFGGPVPFISEMLGDLRFYTSYRKNRDVLLWPQANPDYVDYDWTLRITSDISESIKLRFSSLSGNISTLAENWNYGVYPHWPNEIAEGTGGYPLFNMFSDWAWSVTDIGHRSLSAKLTHTINPSTFYEVSAEYFRRAYDTRPTALRDTSKIYEILPGYFVDEYPLGYWPSESVGIAAYGGIQASRARDFSTSQSLTLKADVTSQLNFSNLLKTGVEFVYNDLDMDYGFIEMQTAGKTYTSRVQMHTFPIRAAFYIQDKLETREFTMNAGLRFDYSHSRTDWWDFDPYDPYFISAKYDPDQEFPMKPSKGQWQLSPRLGISHPITENSKLFFNYGHFKQMPMYENLLRVDRKPTGILSGIGDPNLTLARTISYELGYDQILFNDLLLQVAAFYRDISDQDSAITYNSINNEIYSKTSSSNYEDIRGFEVTLRKPAGRWFAGFVNYTYQASTRGYFGAKQIYQDASKQKSYFDNTPNLYQERPIPSPYARANLSFYTPDDFGPAFLGQHIFGSFMLNLLLTWNQGGWTTYNPKGVSGARNNIQYVDDYDGTLRASKTFVFDKFKIQFLVDVTNLFDRLDLWYDWNLKYRESLHLPENEAWDNIPGNDKIGDYRQPGVEWQPMEYRAEINRYAAPPSERVIYYEGTSCQYWQYTNGEWALVDSRRMYRLLKDKAYIFNPGPSTFWFLDPRKITFGLRVSFDLN